MAHVAQRHHYEQYGVAGKTKPEEQLAEMLHAEGRRGERRNDDAHVRDEVRGVHVLEVELRDERLGEPRHEHEMRDDGGAPQGEGGLVGNAGGEARELHDRHEQRGARARHHRIAHVLGELVGREGDLRQQQHDEHCRNDATGDVHGFGEGSEQIAERYDAERNARNGYGDVFDEGADCFHDGSFLLEMRGLLFSLLLL